MSWGEKRKKAEDEKDILRTIEELREELNFARMQFNEVTEPEMVDACVYQISSLQAKYNYFLRLARELEVKRPYTEQHRALVGGASGRTGG